MEQPQREPVQGVRHERRGRALVVDSVTPLGDHFVSITFGGAALVNLISLGFDDHVKFILDAGAGGRCAMCRSPSRDWRKTPRAFRPIKSRTRPIFMKIWAEQDQQ